MNSEIRTNKLKVKINRTAICEKYSVFQIKTSDKFFPSGVYIIDDPVLNNSVLSVLFESGNAFYILSDINTTTARSLKTIIDKTQECEKISFEEKDISSLPESVILQLMLNALSSQKLSFLKFSNLTGRFYVYHPEWIERSKKDGTIFQIKTLEYKITTENKLMINVRTFTSGLLRKQISFKKKKYKDYPKYILSANNTLRRKLVSDDEKEEFILRQIDNKKSEIPFLDFTDFNSFESTKMGVTANIIESFNEKYSGYAYIDLDTVNEYLSIDCKSTLKKANDKVVTTILKDKSINIVDCVADEYSQMFCNKVIEQFKDKYGLDAKIAKRLSKDDLNIRIIHNDAYYGSDLTDPHDSIPIGYAVQHITLEDFSKHIEFAVTTVAHEIIIKDDLNKGKISLFDWTDLGFDKTVSFGSCAIIDETEHYYFMDIHPNGRFNIKESSLDLFSMDTYSDLVSIFCDNNKVKGIVRFGNGEINIIEDTDLFTIPEIFSIKNELKNNKPISRGKESRDELLSAVLDIKLCREEGSDQYFVGTIGSGMRSKVERASLIRKIKGYNGSVSHFDTLLPLMNIVFVRNGQLTVYPFPFKYLNEYIKYEKRV